MTPVVVTPLPLAGLMLVQPYVAEDERGRFVKTVHAPSLAEHGLHFELREEFYSVSRRGVLRGMHFQLPPHDHQKLVTCVRGRALDVFLDLRKGSATYGDHWAVELSGATPQTAWIPRGLAHGFLALEDDTYMTYKTDREHAPSHDAGILWSSFGFDWPMPAGELTISPRDREHTLWAEFRSPF